MVFRDPPKPTDGKAGSQDRPHLGKFPPPRPCPPAVSRFLMSCTWSPVTPPPIPGPPAASRGGAWERLCELPAGASDTPSLGSVPTHGVLLFGDRGKGCVGGTEPGWGLLGVSEVARSLSWTPGPWEGGWGHVQRALWQTRPCSEASGRGGSCGCPQARAAWGTRFPRCRPDHCPEGEAQWYFLEHGHGEGPLMGPQEAAPVSELPCCFMSCYRGSSLAEWPCSYIGENVFLWPE